MLDHATLSPQAMAYYNGLPLEAQIALAKSNDTFHSLEEMKEYRRRMASGADKALYQTLPEPDVPSNAALDALDSE